MKVWKKREEILKEANEIIESYGKGGCNLYLYDLRYSVSLMNKADELSITILCMQCSRAVNGCKLQEEIAEKVKMSVRRLFKEDIMLIKVNVESVF